ncbi:Tripartite motif-containing protein 29, partial [Dissostichus eleginoides]
MPPGGDSTEVVWCDVCTGGKQPAVSSCLTCTASYCREHLQPHLSSSFYSKHPLMEPQEALRGRTCRTHRRLMEVRGITLTVTHINLLDAPPPNGGRTAAPKGGEGITLTVTHINLQDAPPPNGGRTAAKWRTHRRLMEVRGITLTVTHINLQDAPPPNGGRTAAKW